MPTDRIPISAMTRLDEIIRATMDGLVRVFPGAAIVLLVAPAGKGNTMVPAGRVNYISNAHRGDVIKMLEEVAGRFRQPGAADNEEKAIVSPITPKPVLAGRYREEVARILETYAAEHDDPRDLDVALDAIAAVLLA